MIDLWSRIEPREAEIVRDAMTRVPVKVGELAANLGVTVVKSQLKPNVSGLIQPSSTSPSGFEIKVNKFESSERQRFTIAHEIAHYLLHRNDIGRGVVDTILYRSALTSRKEVEANRLAAEIVMPYDMIRRRLLETGRAPSEAVALDLAQQFSVSAPAMRIRLGVS